MDMITLKKKCIDKLANTSKRIKDSIPYTTENGKYNDYSGEKAFWWTNSFWGGILWRMFDETGDKIYANYTKNVQEKLANVLHLDYNNLDHDLGFLWLLTGVENYKHTKDLKARNDSLLAASVLASRFNGVGNYIQAWNGENNLHSAIIDCMMNLPLLYWASEELKDDRFSYIAKKHADTVMKVFIRENGSSRHIVSFDNEGNYKDDFGGQGYKKGSSWTRGQSWAVYGFIQSYNATKEQRYLDTAIKCANYFIGEAKKNDYKVKCDFCQPECDELYDSSAAAIASCGLLDIAEATGDRKYYDEAVKLLDACDKNFCPWDDENDEALLNYGCEMYSKHEHLALIYGDYYFFTAVCKAVELGKNFN